MENRLIEPFVDSLTHTFRTMVGMTPRRRKVYRKDNPYAEGDISGIIGFAGESIVGSVAISFPAKTALLVFKKILGFAVEDLNSDVQDLIGELANIITGNAQNTMKERGCNFHITLPSVVVGESHIIHHKHKAPVTVIPFNLNGYAFIMEICLKLAGDDSSD